MENIFLESKVLWSQVDANAHLRHSAYADFAAQARLELLGHVGLEPYVFFKLQIGPILFREELLYLKEVGLMDTVKVSCELTASRADGSKWSIRHYIYRGDGVKAAEINVDGAWIDIARRKLTVLPEDINAKFQSIPKSADFKEIPASQKQNSKDSNANNDHQNLNTMTLKETFEQAAAESKTAIKQKPDNDTLLRLYSLYKQGTEGDAPAEGPTNMFDFVGKAKHDAWTKIKGLSAEDAMQQYIDLVNSLKG
jgi:acyl-CoA thioester hydrolase